MPKDKKCAHPACNCMAPAGKKYCSQYCADAADLTEIACECGHQGCVAKAAAGAAPMDAT